MRMVKDLLIGVAASMVAWIVTEQTGGLTPGVRLLVIGATFVIAMVLAIMLDRRKAGRRVAVASGSEIKGDLGTKLRKTEIESGGDVDVLSNNRIKGKADIEIDGLTIKDKP